jgi:hypothetical protein
MQSKPSMTIRPQLKKNLTSKLVISLRSRPHPRMGGGVVSYWMKLEDSRVDMCSRATSSVCSDATRVSVWHISARVFFPTLPRFFDPLVQSGKRFRGAIFISYCMIYLQDIGLCYYYSYLLLCCILFVSMIPLTFVLDAGHSADTVVTHT